MHRLHRRYGRSRFIGPRLMTLAEAKAQLRPLGVALTKRDGEYRVNRTGASERQAYYTTDLWDAVETGKTMTGLSGFHFINGKMWQVEHGKKVFE